MMKRVQTRDERRSKWCRPALEALEGRQLMSLGAGFPSPINTTTRNNQFNPDNASSSSGNSVVVWTDTFSNTDHDIRAQRFDRAGNKVGPEIVVSFSSLDEDQPKVAMNNGGEFVVTWTQMLPGGDTNVVARRYGADGNAAGGVIQVARGPFRESDPDVGIDDRGDFVVTYTRDYNDGDTDVFALLFDGSNRVLALDKVAISPPGVAENHASVAMSPDGRFDVVWEQPFSNVDHDIYMSRYFASGGPMGTSLISDDPANDTRPSISMDHGDDAVVAWQRQRNGVFDIMARQVSAGGTLGNEIRVTTSTDELAFPSVAVRRPGGSFVVTFEEFTAHGIENIVAEVPTNNLNAITLYAVATGSAPSVSINGFDEYIVTYSLFDTGDSNIHGRHGHLL
jgi:hypothetical protein